MLKRKDYGVFGDIILRQIISWGGLRVRTTFSRRNYIILISRLTMFI
jgi:hypothetical protein